jgi:hypothetical protein
MFTVCCPGCRREIPVAEHELGAIVITCAACETRFAPQPAPSRASARTRAPAGGPVERADRERPGGGSITGGVPKKIQDLGPDVC